MRIMMALMAECLEVRWIIGELLHYERILHGFYWTDMVDFCGSTHSTFGSALLAESVGTLDCGHPERTPFAAVHQLDILWSP